MAVSGKCKRRDCVGFAFDDAEHIEDAVNKLRFHYRMEHPTKVFWSRNAAEQIEVYNLSCDELIEGYLGAGWKDNAGDPQVIDACTRLCRYYSEYPKATIDAIRAVAAERGQDIADPFEADNGEPQPAPNAAPGPPPLDVNVVFEDEEEDPF